MSAPDDIQPEEWRSVAGFEALYEVSSLGRVRRIGKAARNGKGRGGGARIGLVLKPQRRKGYLAVQLWRDGQPKSLLLHVVVAVAFHGPVAQGKEVNHCDGVKTNCRASNLEYLTRPENMKHAYRTGLRVAVVPTGIDHHNAKLTPEKARQIRARHSSGACTLSALAREFVVDRSTIRSIILEKTWRENQ